MCLNLVFRLFHPLGSECPLSTEADIGAKRTAARSNQMPNAKDRAERQDRHANEVEASQDQLRESIRETERLVDESDKVLREHRREPEEEDTKASEVK